MPELPEVEIFKRFMDRHALNQPIQAVEVRHPKGLRGVTEATLSTVLLHNQLVKTLRRGKHLLAQLNPVNPKGPALSPPHWLLFHFGMTGCLSYTAPNQLALNAYGDGINRDAHIRVSFTLADGGKLHFHDQRLFGYIGLIHDPQAYFQSKKLGPDALTVDEAEFLKQLRHKKGAIKPVLMDQSVVAGLGNIYVDELLFQMQLHPEQAMANLSPTTLSQLHSRMQEILSRSIALKTDRDQLPPSYLWHQRQPKGHCPRDGQLLSIQTVGGRTTYFCPQCQLL
jgi:formamidopyrimidine-DNA glycosylase